MAARNDRFESNFLTLQGNLNTRHMITHRVTRTTFPFIPVSWNRATILEYKGPRTTEWRRAWLLLHSPCAHGNSVKTMGGMSTPWFNQVLKLTDYHTPGMWLVRSKTWLPLPHITTLEFLLNRRGLNYQQKYHNISLSVDLVILT
jgi:hypothetical protein